MAKVRLGDIATVVTKGTTPTTMGFQFEDGGINFVKIESISEDGTFLKEKFSHISDECNVQMRRSQLQENDILFSIAGAIGRSAIVTKEILPANTNQALAIIRVPKGKIDYNYLLYALSSSAINQQATQHQQGVAQLNISLKNVSDFLLPIYTEAMQKQIVHNLKKIDKLISLRKQQLAKLDELVKVRFVEMFENNLWPNTSLNDICSEIVDCPHSTPKYEGNLEHPAIRTTEIKKGYIDWDSMKYVSEEEYQKRIKSLKPVPGDIVYGREGTYGNAAIIPDGYEFCLGQRVMLFRPNKTKCISAYVLYAILSDHVKRQADEKNVGATVPHVNVADAKQFDVVLPPLSIQNQFAAFVERVDKQKQTVQQSLEKLELMKKALMQEYFG